MADKTEKTEEMIAKIEKKTPAAAPGGAAAPLPVVVGVRHVPLPQRLSKGQRKHIRRLKQAGTYKPSDRLR
jgi:hypothetical protein